MAFQYFTLETTFSVITIVLLIEKEVQKWINFGNQRYSLNIKAKNYFNLRHKFTAAEAFAKPSKNIFSIYFNLRLVKANIKTYLEEIVPHEVGHLFQYALYPKDTTEHGKYWKQIMKDFGFENPKISYNLKSLPRQYQYVKAKCGCSKPFKITKIIENRINQGHEYFCSWCENKIFLI